MLIYNKLSAKKAFQQEQMSTRVFSIASGEEDVRSAPVPEKK